MNEHNLDDIDENEEESIFITLESEDGTEKTGEVIALFDADEQKYAAVVIVEEDDNEEGEIYFFRFDVDEDKEEATLIDIDDDDEWEMVEEAFQELLDEEEGGGIIDEE